MNDPHVVALIYQVRHGNSVDYSQAEPFTKDESEFRLNIEENQARFEFKRHYATEAEAKEALQNYIRNWEFDASFRHGPDYFRLEYSRPEIIDRNPTPKITTAHALPITAHVSISKASGISFPPAYPLPPSDINLDLDVETMYQRYMEYLKGREKLTSMAQFCLTLLRRSKGSLKETAREYGIQLKVLSTIGDLCANKGGPKEARKAHGIDNPLSTSETHFLEEAIKRIIRRAAEKLGDPYTTLPKITLQDLPQFTARRTP